MLIAFVVQESLCGRKRIERGCKRFSQPRGEKGSRYVNARRRLQKKFSASHPDTKVSEDTMDPFTSALLENNHQDIMNSIRVLDHLVSGKPLPIIGNDNTGRKVEEGTIDAVTCPLSEKNYQDIINSIRALDSLISRKPLTEDQRALQTKQRMKLGQRQKSRRLRKLEELNGQG